MADAAVVANAGPAGDGAGDRGGAAAGGEAGPKFQSAISAWRTIGLTALVSTLDNTASEIVTYQRDSTVQRKDLAQKTKDFRKLDDAAKLSDIKGLLKAYQTFIDLLTNHSKSVNAAFIQTYNALSEAPDPYPLLEASVDAMLVAEDTLPQLTQENAHLHRTVAALTAQLDTAEAALQTERAARRAAEDRAAAQVREVEQSWTAVLEEKKAHWAAKEQALEDKVENQDRLLSEIKATYEVNQRLGGSGGGGGGSSGGGGSGADAGGDHADDGLDAGRRPYVTSAELEMVHADLERTAARLAGVEARNEQLVTELAQAKAGQATTAGAGAGAAPSSSSRSVEDDPAYLQVLAQNASLARKLDASRVAKEAARRDTEARLRGLEREVGLLRDERDALKTKVHKWRDYDDVQQELEVLKSIEFSTGDDEEEAEDAEDAPGEGGGGKKDSLEQLLLARNKKLSEEATILRVSHHDLQARVAQLEAAGAQKAAEVARLQALSEKLENDLAAVEAEAPHAFPSGASVAGTYVSRYAPTGGGGGGGGSGRRGGSGGGGGRSTSPTSSIISGFDARFAGSDGPSSGAGGGAAGILPMITAQRDRFKKRMAQLEQELAEERRTVSQLRQEIAALQRDNLNLYEKTRYMSSYNRGGASSATSVPASASAYASNPNPAAVSIGAGSIGIGAGAGATATATIDRYRKAYESNLSPFQAFRGRESARAYRRLSLPERVVYSITRMVLASRTSRNLFAAYCVALHLVVFLSLYWLGGLDVERHGSHLGQTAAALAAGPGGGPAAGAAGAAGAAAGANAHGDWQEEGFSH